MIILSLLGVVSTAYQSKNPVINAEIRDSKDWALYRELRKKCTREEFVDKQPYASGVNPKGFQMHTCYTFGNPTNISFISTQCSLHRSCGGPVSLLNAIGSFCGTATTFQIDC